MPAPTIAPPAAPSISVLVPSYGRAGDLAECLRALQGQRLAPEEVIVVVRAGDEATRAVCERAELKTLRVVEVTAAGMVAALNAGRQAVRSELIAITDDDAQPEADWLEQIADIFSSDSCIGAVGGPDLVHGQVAAPAAPGSVGRVSRYGRMSGNHHAGAVREDVHFLKGVNMAYRLEALAGFDEFLRGAGAQVGNDMQASLSVWRRGYRVVYDPHVRVRHYPAARAEGDERNHRSLRMLRDQHHNETYSLATTLPPVRSIVCCGYAVLVGYRSALGLAHLIVRLVTGPQRVRAVAEFGSVLLGRIEGIATALNARRTRRSRGPGATR